MIDWIDLGEVQPNGASIIDLRGGVEGGLLPCQDDVQLSSTISQAFRLQWVESIAGQWTSHCGLQVRNVALCVVQLGVIYI